MAVVEDISVHLFGCEQWLVNLNRGGPGLTQEFGSLCLRVCIDVRLYWKRILQRAGHACAIEMLFALEQLLLARCPRTKGAGATLGYGPLP